MNKTLFNRLVALVGITLLLLSCQKEEREFIDDTNDPETISVNSELTRMLISASQNDGTKDNLIDGSSCLSVKYPLTVEANGQTVVLNAVADIGQVQAIFDQSSSDVDELVIQFPITVIFEDFNTLVVNSQIELNAIASVCENNIDDFYSCVDFIYPISCFIYNEVNEQTGLVTLDDNEEWFEYLNYLEENIFIAIDYPMQAVINGEIIQFNTNQELLNAFNQVDCSSPADPSDFEEILTSGTWYVNHFVDSGDDETCDFYTYGFTFDAGGQITASSDSDTRNGTWTLVNDSDTVKLIFDFDLQGTNDPFEDLIEDWKLLDYNTEAIQLQHISGGGGGTDTLTYGRDPFTDCGGSGGGQDLIDILLDGTWYVATYLDDGNDETSSYEGFELTFSNSGTVVADDGIHTYYGDWEVTGSSDLDLVLDFGTQLLFDEFNDDWDVLNYTDTTINLEDVSGGGGGTDTLIFEKL